MGVSAGRQGQGLGRLLVAQALRQAWTAGRTLAFVGVVVDCLDEPLKAFYERFDFVPLPDHPLRVYLSSRELGAMLEGE